MRLNMDVGSKREELHGFIIGTEVFAYDDPYKIKRTIVAIGGLRKDDHIQIDSLKSPWVYAKNYHR